MLKNIALISITISLTSACADKSDKIAADYVSPMQYNSYNCRQIEEEAARVSARASKAVAVQDKQAKDDAVATGVGLILFWPALFFIDGNSPGSSEVGRLKGEMEALEQASIKKNCGIEFRSSESTPT